MWDTVPQQYIYLLLTGELVLNTIMTTWKQAAHIASSGQLVKWWKVLEHFRLGRSLLKRVILLVQDGFSKEVCISSYLFLRAVYRLGRKSGWLFAALYLKQCSVSLKLAYGGIFKPSVPQSVPVSLTGSGYPRIIPAHHRKMILKRDDRSDRLIKLYLSFFSFFSIIEKAKKFNSSVLKSITTPLQDSRSVEECVRELTPLIKPLLDRYIPKLRSIPLNQGIEWIPTLKSLPTYAYMKMRYKPDSPEGPNLKMPRKVSPLMVLHLELLAFFGTLYRVPRDLNEACRGALFPHRIRFAFDPKNEFFTRRDMEQFLSPLYGDPQSAFTLFSQWQTGIVGRLGQKIEGGGKRRLFAMGSWVTQRLLSPIGEWLGEVLRTIRMDGTFHQTLPLTYLRGSRTCHSLDLSSATDRWPLAVMSKLMEVMFGKTFALSSVDTALAENHFYVPFLRGNRGDPPLVSWVLPRNVIHFQAGQPLGFRSSWPLFALSHHLVVWWAAEQVRPGATFTGYALLGDDIVITDELVAAEYRKIISRLGVAISEAKSLVSYTGALEFAKRFIIRNASVDLSPVTVKSVLGAHIPRNRSGLAALYPIQRFTTFRRLGGAGYKSLLRSNRLKGSDASTSIELALWLKGKSLCLSWFLGGGRFLTPEEYWWVFRESLGIVRPRPLTPFEPDMLMTDDERWMAELLQMRAVVSGWYRSMSDWYRYYRISECIDTDTTCWSKDTWWVPMLDSLWRLVPPSGWYVNREDPILTVHSRLVRLLQRLHSPTRVRTLSIPPGVVRSDPDGASVSLSEHPCRDLVVQSYGYVRLWTEQSTQPVVLRLLDKLCYYLFSFHYYMCLGAYGLMVGWFLQVWLMGDPGWIWLWEV